MDAAELEALLHELIVHQHKKVFDFARRLDSSLTEDDIQQPHDFPALAQNPEWNYEDGVLAGYLAAQMAIRSRLRRS